MENILHNLNTFPNKVKAEEAKISTSGQTSYTDPVTHENYIVIKGINGKMRANYEMVSSFAVKLWIRKDENDETIDESELIYNGSISIIKGKVSLNGDFEKDFGRELYRSSSENEQGVVSFLGGDLIIKVKLRSGATIDDVVVIGDSDGYPNDNVALGMIQQITEAAILNNEVKFNVYPNPSNKEMYIDYTFKSAANATVNINLYDSEGKHLKMLSNTFVKRDEELKIKLSDTDYLLIPGVYFIVVDDGSKKYLRRIIKE